MERIDSHKRKISVLEIHLLAILLFGSVLTLLECLGLLICPMKMIFGIPCPFCGMTRAHLAALRLDFSAAFAHNPAFFTALPLLWLIFHSRLLGNRWYLRLVRYTIIAVLSAILLTSYFYLLLA